MEKREQAVGEFSGVFGALYKEVADLAGMTALYLPSWKSTNSNDVLAHLQKRRTQELSSGISLSGPHLDRYMFARNGADFTGKASTGQRRLLALLLRVAQARRFPEMTGKNPVLLLDDVLLEMDGEKKRKFLSVLPVYDQAFYTFLPEEPYQLYRKADTIVYRVDSGRVSL